MVARSLILRRSLSRAQKTPGQKFPGFSIQGPCNVCAPGCSLQVGGGWDGESSTANHPVLCWPRAPPPVAVLGCPAVTAFCHGGHAQTHTQTRTLADAGREVIVAVVVSAVLGAGVTTTRRLRHKQGSCWPRI